MEQLTRTRARQFILAKQGLLGTHRFAGKDGAYAARRADAMQEDIIRLRPHHALCLRHFVGKGYSPAKRIIEPFEKAMDALQQQGVLERWEYCLSKGEPLGQPDVNDYNYFASLYVLYEIKDFPIGEELPRIQATAEKRQKRKERIERLIDSNVAKGKARAILEQEESKTE